MANRKITDLPEATVINDGDTFHITQSSVDKRGNFRFVKDQILLETQPLVTQAEAARDAAQSSQTAAAGSATTAQAALTNFTDTYYGPLASDPTQAPSGGALGTGDLYFNTTNNQLRIYNGSTWVDATENDAVSVNYNNASSGLTATNAQAAIDEVVSTRIPFARSGRKNSLINGRFIFNQRVVSGTVVLTAGQYGHDRMKAGASGCTYTFTSTNGTTELNITAGSLLQTVEAMNITPGTNVLSWSGTAQGRIDLGAYGSSGNVTATLDGSANVDCEWNTGTLSLIQLEQGMSPTTFEYRNSSVELMLCRHYFRRIGGAQELVFSGFSNASTVGQLVLPFRDMRAAPSISASSGGALQLANSGGAFVTTTALTFDNIGANGARILASVPAGTLTAGNGTIARMTSSSTYIDLDSEV